MKTIEFKEWMIEVCEFDERTIGSRISACKRVELAYGDLEKQYMKDRCEKLISELTYSIADEKEDRPAKHKINIVGNIRNGTATLKQSVQLYVEFEDDFSCLEEDDDFENDFLDNDTEIKNDIIEKDGGVYYMDKDGFIGFDKHLNGFNSLSSLIGDEDTFIKFFVTNSIFMSREAVDKQAVSMKIDIANQEKIPVRYSQKMKEYFRSDAKRVSAITNRKDAVEKSRAFDFYSKHRENIKIEFDSTGNKNVVDAINKYANVDYSKFINYNLSHVWGQTYDPYFFTSLWNVVIVPGYLNPIMDKPESQQKINGRIQSIIKAICIELYKPNKLLSENIVPEIDKEFKEIALSFINEGKLKFLGTAGTERDFLKITKK